MANSTVEIASSSASCCSYHVFLSFRGKDTRKTFSDHLHTALSHAGFHTFRDNDEIRRGHNIESELQKAIEESKICIIVFSKNYASSRWCLNELVQILDHKRTSPHFWVLPVFYDVLPSHVRDQARSLAEEFEQINEEKMEGWRAALLEAADLAGMVLPNQADGHEAKFIQKIVQEVGNKLNRTVFSVAPYLIGLQSRISKIDSWLRYGSSYMLVLYGIGGIGKTTIAKTFFNLNAEKFEARSFLANVRENSAQPNGIVRLQKQLLSDIRKGRKEKINNFDEGIVAIEEATCCKKVLIVLDDLDEEDQVLKILGWRQQFHSGSKIIMTTRHKNLLKRMAKEVQELEVKELDDDESLQLFSLHAFGQNYPIKGYIEPSKRVIHYCGGLPLALQILGSSLSGSSEAAWNSAIEKLKAIPDIKIQKVLEISCESLDDHDKNLFLDIACFFVGKDRDNTVKILDASGFYTAIGIQNLIDRSLVTINTDSKLMMHQLLRNMGRGIVHRESPEEPGKRSRLWCHNDTLNVLRELDGTEKIEGIILDLHELQEDKLASSISNTCDEDDSDTEQVIQEETKASKGRLSIGDFLRNTCNTIRATTIPRIDLLSKELDLKTDAFTKMHKLRLLQLNYVQLTGNYEKFPKTLRWLCWHGFSSKTIPNDFYLEKLVALDMRYSSMEQTWEGTRFFKILKILNLSHCHYLTRTPNFCGLPMLETLILKDCISLVLVHESIGDLKRLVLLNLKGCKNLRKLPREIGMVKSLKKLILSGCSKLDELPELEKLESLTMFHADDIAINPLFNSGEAVSLHNLFWNLISRRTPTYTKFALYSLPRSLVSLSLENCNISDDGIPSDLSSLVLLGDLNLSGNPIYGLPKSIKGLSKLKSLHLVRCTRLQSLPELPPKLVKLFAQYCTSLERIENLPRVLLPINLGCYGCEKLVEVKNLYKLEPIENIDSGMISDLGLFNLGSMENISVKLASRMTSTARSFPLQGFNECGVFSVFLPGSNVPDWFTHKSMKSPLSFYVPQDNNFRIRGLNICVVYEISSEEFGHEHSLHVLNKTRGLHWTYRPTFHGVPEKKEGMLWLCHMKVGNQFKCGDEAQFFFDMAKGFIVKQCGVQLVYHEEELQYDCVFRVLGIDPSFQKDGYELILPADIPNSLRCDPYLYAIHSEQFLWDCGFPVETILGDRPNSKGWLNDYHECYEDHCMHIFSRWCLYVTKKRGSPS